MAQSSNNKRRFLIWAFALFQIAWLLGFARLGLILPSDNRIDIFAVQDDPTAEAYEIFREAFGDREHFLVCLQLQQLPDDDQVEAIHAFYNDLSDNPHIKLLADGISWTEDLGTTEVQSPFPFWSSGTGVLTAIFDLVDHPDRQTTLTRVQEFAQAFAEEAWVQQAVVAGEPLTNLGLNQSSEEVRDQIFPILILVSMLFLGYLFRAWRATLVALLAVLLSMTTVMGTMALLQLHLNLVTTLIPALVFVLSLAMQIHVLIGISQKADVLAGVRTKIKPNFLVAFTTSIGFGSLMTSQVQPIAEMGAIMAFSIWVIFAWTHLVHLGWSLALGLRVQDRLRQGMAHLGDKPGYHQLIRRPWIAVLGLIIVLTGTYALLTNPMESNGLRYFPDHHPVAQQAAFLETKVTGSSDLELIFPTSEPVDLESLMTLSERLEQHAEIRQALSLASLATYLSELSREAGEELPLDEALELLREEMPDIALHFERPGWIRLQMLVNAVDRETFRELETFIEQSQAALNLPTPILTGSLARVVNIQSYLLSSLFKGLSITILLVFVLMTVIFRKIHQPHIVLLPNLFPLGCMALTMLVFDMPTTISTVMVFSIAFGIAVDDTIHLMFAFRYRHLGDFETRWRLVLISDGRAVMLTTIVLALGFCVLLLSDFLPTQHFGILLATGMIAAFLGDITLLPNLLQREAQAETK
jgi:predicted RND superfamily exporter protein